MPEKQPERFKSTRKWVWRHNGARWVPLQRVPNADAGRARVAVLNSEDKRK